MDEVGVCVSWEVKTEIRGERDNQVVRFDLLKIGEPFYYKKDLLMRINSITDVSLFREAITYNCVFLSDGRPACFNDNTIVRIAKVHIEKEY